MTEQEWMRDFGQNLKFLLKYKGYTQKDLADMIYMSEGSISRYISGDMMPSVRVLVQIGYALECEPGDLLDFSEDID